MIQHEVVQKVKTESLMLLLLLVSLIQHEVVVLLLMLLCWRPTGFGLSRPLPLCVFAWSAAAGYRVGGETRRPESGCLVAVVCLPDADGETVRRRLVVGGRRRTGTLSAGLLF